MKTLFDKIWDAHVVTTVEDGPTQLYIDRLYCHEVTSPQAFRDCVIVCRCIMVGHTKYLFGTQYSDSTFTQSRKSLRTSHFVTI